MPADHNLCFLGWFYCCDILDDRFIQLVSIYISYILSCGERTVVVVAVHVWRADHSCFSPPTIALFTFDIKQGGAVYVNGGSAIFTECTLSENTAERGHAFVLWYKRVWLLDLFSSDYYMYMWTCMSVKLTKFCVFQIVLVWVLCYCCCLVCCCGIRRSFDTCTGSKRWRIVLLVETGHLVLCCCDLKCWNSWSCCLTCASDHHCLFWGSLLSLLFDMLLRHSTLVLYRW